MACLRSSIDIQKLAGVEDGQAGIDQGGGGVGVGRFGAVDRQGEFARGAGFGGQSLPLVGEELRAASAVSRSVGRRDRASR